MTDLEMEMLCHESIGYKLEDDLWPTWMLPWNPLAKDAQAMALVKEFSIMIDRSGKNNGWYASLVVDPKADDCDIFEGEDVNLNRAIVECVAKMQAVKK